MPTTGQLTLLALSIVLFAVGGMISLVRLRHDSRRRHAAARICQVAGLLAAIGVLAWHSTGRGEWQPLDDNFESLTWLAVILTGFVIYLQSLRPIRGLDWFIMPIVIVLLIGAAVFGRIEPHRYRTLGEDAWLWVHHVASYAAALAFAIAAAGAALYVVAARRLRRKSAGPPLASLERLERLMMMSVTLGFALLTVGMITGFGRMFARDQVPSYAKLLFASLAWVVYAIVMHAPINPRFRGRRAAILTVLGFVLIFGVIIAVQLMPGGGR